MRRLTKNSCALFSGWYNKSRKRHLSGKEVISLRNKQVSVLDVAHYILVKCGKLTTMKLQKITYYCQAWSLAWDELPLFDEDFQAWANGPVCPELFAAHRGMFEVGPKDIPGNPELFDPNQKETMDNVIQAYADKSPQWLSDLTHSEGPWREARKRRHAAPGERCDEIITKEEMQSFYGGLIGS